ncbi:class I SAM-dependent methyltransferase [Natronorubrum sp. FCH18a]|uniref:class I SAM-dependent methyltransferase n=1 Tax=Natronorubrum sp. FCH18a TaxID=3447018 RepID=UPI003F51A160
MSNLLGLLRRGLNRPDKIPRYLWGLLVPSDRWGPEWRRRDDLVLFEPGGFAASARTRAEFASNLFHEVTGLWTICDDHLEETPTRSLEVGCGYGRLTPWIAMRSERHVAVEPDRRALERAVVQYGRTDGDPTGGTVTAGDVNVAFARGRAESLPVPDDAFDLVVTWTVLQHVPPERIGEAVSELRRVLAPGGLVVCCERVRPPADDHIWPRSLETYAELFEPLECVDDRRRSVEPTWSDAMSTDRPAERVLAFREG